MGKGPGPQPRARERVSDPECGNGLRKPDTGHALSGWRDTAHLTTFAHGQQPGGLAWSPGRCAPPVRASSVHRQAVGSIPGRGLRDAAGQCFSVFASYLTCDEKSALGWG